MGAFIQKAMSCMFELECAKLGEQEGAGARGRLGALGLASVFEPVQPHAVVP
jgi:hypothetical protein